MRLCTRVCLCMRVCACVCGCEISHGQGLDLPGMSPWTPAPTTSTPAFVHLLAPQPAPAFPPSRRPHRPGQRPSCLLQRLGSQGPVSAVRLAASQTWACRGRRGGAVGRRKPLPLSSIPVPTHRQASPPQHVPPAPRPRPVCTPGEWGGHGTQDPPLPAAGAPAAARGGRSRRGFRADWSASRGFPHTTSGRCHTRWRMFAAPGPSGDSTETARDRLRFGSEVKRVQQPLSEDPPW